MRNYNKNRHNSSPFPRSGETAAILTTFASAGFPSLFGSTQLSQEKTNKVRAGTLKGMAGRRGGWF